MDGYRSQPDPHQSPYPSSYDQGYEPRTYHAPSYHQEPQNREPQSPKSRSSSIAPSDGLPQPSQQPLKNALNNAFDKSDSAAKVDPDIIAQITAEVKKSVLSEIKMNGMGVTGQPVPPHLYAPPVQSPDSTTAIPSRNVYTPPSPKHADLSSHGSASPDPLARDPMFDGADDTPTPPDPRATKHATLENSHRGLHHRLTSLQRLRRNHGCGRPQRNEGGNPLPNDEDSGRSGNSPTLPQLRLQEDRTTGQNHIRPRTTICV